METDYRSIFPDRPAAVRVVSRAGLVFSLVAQAGRRLPVGSIERMIKTEDVELVVMHVEARP